MTRAPGRTIGLCCAIAWALAGCATTPEQDPVLQDKLGDLDARLTRVDRVVSNSSLLDLSNQLEALRADLRGMHNDIDELTHALDTSRKQQHDLYADLDQRLKLLEARAGVANGPAGGSGATAGSGATTGGAAAAATVAAGGATDTGASATASSGAGAADTVSYQAAFALLKSSRYDQAIQAFQSFLGTYPTSPLADNAQYWLGEAYYVNKAFPEAQAAFQRVVDKYPQSRKVPDALLKVGYCDYELKQWQTAREVLTQVKSTYADTPAGRLAQQRLDMMASENH